RDDDVPQSAPRHHDLRGRPLATPPIAAQLPVVYDFEVAGALAGSERLRRTLDPDRPGGVSGPHRSLRLQMPEGARIYPREGRVVRGAILGGLINNYYRKAG
ncbi:unnamed protein product, partial [marine sediment metagenome]